MKSALVFMIAVLMGTTGAKADRVAGDTVVGLITINMPAGTTRLIGCTFADFHGKSEISIHRLLGRQDLYADKGGNPDKCDQIYVMKDQVYESYYYIFSEDVGENAWIDVNGMPATVTFAPGDAFFYKRSADSPATTITLKGDVPVDNSDVKVPFPKGFKGVQKDAVKDGKQP